MQVLGDSNFLNSLKLYDKDNISPAILKKIERYVKDPEFTPEKVGNVSKAARGLCMWVHAMDVYSKVAKEVEPKKEKLAKLNAELDTANEKLAKKQAELQAVVDKVCSRCSFSPLVSKSKTHGYLMSQPDLRRKSGIRRRQ